MPHNCNLIITVGFPLADATAAAATANPDTTSRSSTSRLTPPIPNVKGLTFETDQAAFLAGYAAAGSTKTGTVATFGGVNIPTVTIFMDGFLAGVNYFNTDTGGSVKVLGWDGKNGPFTGDFDDQTKGQTLAQGFIDQGADIIMPVAGPVGLGAAAAAQAAGNMWIVGVDSDWTLTTDYADIILTSVLKNIGPAVYDVVEEAATGAGVHQRRTTLARLRTVALASARARPLFLPRLLPRSTSSRPASSTAPSRSRSPKYQRQR